MHTQHISSYFKHTSITRYALHTFIPSIIQNNITISQSYKKYIFTLLSFTSFIHSLIHSVIQYSTCKGLIDCCVTLKTHDLIIQLYWL